MHFIATHDSARRGALEGQVQSFKWPFSLVLTCLLVLAFIAATGTTEALKAEMRPWMQHAMSYVLGTSSPLEAQLLSQPALPVQRSEVFRPAAARVSSDDLRYWTSHYMGREVELADMHSTPQGQGAQCFSPDGLLAVGAVLAGPASAQDALRDPEFPKIID